MCWLVQNCGNTQKFEFSFLSLFPPKVVGPVEKRALKVKAEICDAEGLGHKLESKENEVKDIKRQLKLKVLFMFIPLLYIVSDCPLHKNEERT